MDEVRVMPDVPSEAVARRTPPLISVWLAPRQTIERIVTEWPHHLVLPLAVLGGIAVATGALIDSGLGGVLRDWRIWLACVALGAVIGIVNLYIYAVFAAWLARGMGGQASTTAVRAVFAWGVLPTILGLLIVLAVVGSLLASGSSAASPLLTPWFQIVNGIFGLWSLVITLLMLARVERFGFWRTMASYWCGPLLLAVLLALLVRIILFQPFNSPSGSMAPTLLNGDYFFVSKYAYGYSHYSLPFSPPLFRGRIFGSEPERGDVVVFRLPKDGATDYVKRVVGLPGDRIQMKQGLLYVNDAPVARERLEDFVGSDPCGPSTARVKRWRETLPNGKSYETLDCVDNGFYDNTSVYTVPEGHFFVMGDNRDNSTDSRVLSAVGYVPLENFIGRVGLIFFSRTVGPGGVAANRPERFGLMVR
jgi:signal peptidase I